MITFKIAYITDTSGAVGTFPASVQQKDEFSISEEVFKDEVRDEFTKVILASSVALTNTFSFDVDIGYCVDPLFVYEIVDYYDGVFSASLIYHPNPVCVGLISRYSFDVLSSACVWCFRDRRQYLRMLRLLSFFTAGGVS